MVNCGSLFTKACLGLTDPRYDPAVSNHLITQDDIWKEFTGYWGPEERRYADVGGSPRLPGFYNPESKGGWPYRSDKMTVFRSIAIEGTRYQAKSFYFYEPGSAEFCEQTPPEGMRNTVTEGEVCGVNGNFQLIEDFGTSSYEKDGTIDLIWKNQGPDSDEISGPPRASTSTLSPADEYGVFAYTDMGFFNVAETFTFSGEQREFLLATATATKHQPTDENFERIVSSSLSPRMEEGEFFTVLRKAFEDHNVKVVPDWLMSAGDGNESQMPDCVAKPWGRCPSANEWCTMGNDPDCSTSPYKEPPSSLNGGGIAALIVALLVVTSLVFYFLNRHLSRKQKHRYRTRFVEQIVGNVNHRGSIGQLKPDDLAAEFRRINTSSNGKISEKELWNFISSGKAGDMDKKDFDALFLSMDVDGTGAVNFMEFCSFMTVCKKDYIPGTGRRLSVRLDAPEEIARLIDAKKIA